MAVQSFVFLVAITSTLSGCGCQHYNHNPELSDGDIQNVYDYQGKELDGIDLRINRETRSIKEFNLYSWNKGPRGDGSTGPNRPDPPSQPRYRRDIDWDAAKDLDRTRRAAYEIHSCRNTPKGDGSTGPYNPNPQSQPRYRRDVDLDEAELELTDDDLDRTRRAAYEIQSWRSTPKGDGSTGPYNPNPPSQPRYRRDVDLDEAELEIADDTWSPYNPSPPSMLRLGREVRVQDTINASPDNEEVINEPVSDLTKFIYHEPEHQRDRRTIKGQFSN